MRNLKRALSLALASVMLLGMMVMGSSAASYPDVDQSNNLEAIDVLQMLGLMEGDEKGNFNPDGEVTRYQMAALVCKLMGLTPGGNSPFTDFGPSDNWAKPYVAAVYNKGIMKGTGATTFDGSRSMTAAETGMAMLKCLGYFLNDAELKDTNWKLATIREAGKIDLYRGINAYTDQVMNRDNIAQMVLNTLESKVVVARPPELNVSVQTGGATVDVTGAWTYDPAENNRTKDYRDGSKPSDLELCEKLYGNDLKKDEDGTADKMGRTATKWIYKNSSIESPVEPDEVYTKAVKGKDIYSDLGKPSETLTTTVYVDGQTEDVADLANLNPKPVEAGFDVASGNGKKVGGDGMIVEVYYNSEDKEVTLVVLRPVVDQIDEVDENDDGERIVKIGSKEFVTKAFEEEDWVVYTEKRDETDNAKKIQSMYAMEVQTGTITKKIGSSKVAIDGKEYTYAGYDNDVDTACAVKDEVDFYLDANGYLAKMDISEGVISVDTLAYVIKADEDRSPYAVLRLADGTKKTVDTDKDYSEGANNFVGHIVSFKEDKNGEYKLTDRTGTGPNANCANGTESDTKKINFKSGKPQFTIDSTTYSTDSKTVFVYYESSGDDVYTYTGYKNAADVTMADATLKNFAAVYTKPGKTAATLVYVQVNSSSYIGSSDDLAFVAYDKDVKLVDEGDDVEYYEYNAVVDGEITTVRVDATTQAANVSGSEGIKVLKSLSKNGDDIVTGATAATAGGTDYTAATSTEKAKNDTIALSGKSYAWADDVKVFFVDDDFNITAGEIGDIRADATVGATGARYEQVLFDTNTDGEVTIIVIQEKL